MLKELKYKLSSTDVDIDWSFAYNSANLIKEMVRTGLGEMDIETTTFNATYDGTTLKSVTVSTNGSDNSTATYSTLGNTTTIELDSVALSRTDKEPMQTQLYSSSGLVAKEIKRKIIIVFAGNNPKEMTILNATESGKFENFMKATYSITSVKTLITVSLWNNGTQKFVFSRSVQFSKFDTSNTSNSPIVNQKNLFLILSASPTPDPEGVILPEAYAFNVKNYKNRLYKQAGFLLNEDYRNVVQSKLLVRRDVLKPTDSSKLKIFYKY